MTSGAAINHEAVRLAIPGSKGIISEIARRCGHSWHAVNGAIKENPILKEAYDAECETQIDKVEGKLFTLIDEGSEQLTKYYLNCKAKRRGYGESLTVSGEIQVLEVQSVTKSKGTDVADQTD